MPRFIFFGKADIDTNISGKKELQNACRVRAKLSSALHRGLVHFFFLSVLRERRNGRDSTFLGAVGWRPFFFSCPSSSTGLASSPAFRFADLFFSEMIFFLFSAALAGSAAIATLLGCSRRIRRNCCFPLLSALSPFGVHLRILPQDCELSIVGHVSRVVPHQFASLTRGILKISHFVLLPSTLPLEITNYRNRFLEFSEMGRVQQWLIIPAWEISGERPNRYLCAHPRGNWKAHPYPFLYLYLYLYGGVCWASFGRDLLKK